MFKVFQINELTRQNTDYRRVIYTDDQMQIVLMSLKPHEDIPSEVHPDITQSFHIVDGVCMANIDHNTIKVAENGEVIIIPAGVRHYIFNPSHTSTLKFYSIYSPPEHPADAVHSTRSQSEAAHNAEEEAREAKNHH